MKHVLPRLIRPLNPIVESSETFRLLGFRRKSSASSIDGVHEIEAEGNGKNSLWEEEEEEENDIMKNAKKLINTCNSFSI